MAWPDAFGIAIVGSTLSAITAASRRTRPRPIRSPLTKQRTSQL